VRPEVRDLAACVVPSGTKAIVDKEPGSWAWRVRVVEGPHGGCSGVVSSSYFKTAKEREEAGEREQRQSSVNARIAEHYLALGMKYKEAGWPEKARDALNQSIAVDPDGVGQKALRLMTAYLPPRPVPAAAASQNIAGFNLMVRNNLDAAIAVFQDCIRQFPEFEWPYGNLGTIYLVQGRTKDAKEILQRAIAVNPSYANGWGRLAVAYARDGDLRSARAAALKALALDPEHSIAKLVLQGITA
jgi:tetratricopeptide (TPR) repeat protein